MTINVPRSLCILFIICAVTIATTPSAAQMKKIKAVVTPYLTFAPYFIAQEEGYFEGQGLEVEFVRFTESSKTIPALMVGDVDVVAGTPFASYFNAIEQGGKIRFVADRNHEEPTGCGSQGILVRKDLVQDGTTAQSQWLKGKRLAASGATSPAKYVTDQLLEEQGLSMQDIEVVSIANQASRIQGFTTDSVDLSLLNEPHLSRALDSGHVVLLKTSGQARPGFQQGIVAFGPNLLTKDPEAGKAFMTAYLQGVRQFNSGKTERNIEIIARHTSLDKELLARLCWPTARTDGKINIQSVTELQTWFFKQGLIDRVLPAEEFWEPRFVEHAVQVLGPAG